MNLRTTFRESTATNRPRDAGLGVEHSSGADSWGPHLPALARSETLYSWCASFHRRACFVDTQATSLALFGDRHAARRHDLPANLNVFAARTGGLLGSASELALKHTLLGFYLAFLRPDRAAILLRAVLDGTAPHLKLQLGIPASRLGARHPLRFCRRCAQEDEQTIGWPIWRVQHQLPAVLVCNRHGCPLWQAVDKVTPVHRRQFFIPPVTESAAYRQIQVMDDNRLEPLARLASWAERVAGAAPGSLGPEALGKAYRAWAHRVGALTPAGSIRYSTLIEALSAKSATSGVTDAAEEVALSSSTQAQILTSALRSAPRPLHPVKHLALIAAVYDDWEALKDDLAATTHIASGRETGAESPHPSGDRRETAETMEARRRDFLLAVRSPMSIRTASQLVGVSTNTGLRWAERAGIEIRHRSKTLNERARIELGSRLAKGEDRADVAAAFGIALTTVNRLLSTDQELNALWRAARFRNAQASCRSTLLAVKGAHPGRNGKQIRQLAPAAWAWLYRNDREWLRANLPAIWLL